MEEAGCVSGRENNAKNYLGLGRRGREREEAWERDGGDMIRDSSVALRRG